MEKLQTITDKEYGTVTEINKHFGFVNLLHTGSEEKEVFGVGSIPDAILPSCQYWIIIAKI